MQFWSAYVPCEGTSFKVHPVRFALGQVDGKSPKWMRRVEGNKKVEVIDSERW